MCTMHYTDSESIKVNKEWNSLQVLEVWVENDTQSQRASVWKGAVFRAGLRSICRDRVGELDPLSVVV